MAANQRNFQLFTYTDEAGHTWNKRGAMDTALNAIDGSTAFTPGAVTWPRESRRYQARAALFQDPQTFRTVKAIMYTHAAAAALTGASTLAVSVPGETTSVSYAFAGLVPEKQPKTKAARQLADHT